MKESLKSLVQPRINIIDSSENNMKFIKLKQDSWREIQEGMKAQGHDICIQRLKETWSRLKMNARSSIAEYNGWKCPEEASELDSQIADMNPVNFEDHATSDTDNLNKSSEEKNNNDVLLKFENKREQQNIYKFRKKRKKAVPQTSEEMVNERIKLIKAETDHEQALFDIKLETEKLNKKHTEKINELKVKIKEEELKLRQKENVLINLKIQKERSLI